MLMIMHAHDIVYQDSFCILVMIVTIAGHTLCCLLTRPLLAGPQQS